MGNTYTKEKAIDIFSKACKSNNPLFIQKRKLSVETQYQRNVWELDCVFRDIGKARIENRDTPKIILFYYQYSMLDGTQKEEFDLSINEYKMLENQYFGKFIENESYLKKFINVAKYKSQ